ncbi:MAG: hypothetical protein MJZ34_05940 [Paludibacteraceae bacterium]|nr:hypothetical protein [Paludibacteraceae bacterium]
MKKIVFNLTKAAVTISFLSLISFSCKEEPEEKIEIQDNLPGTWISKKEVISELEAGSTWKYNEIETHDSGEWINIPYTFTNNGSYRIESVDSNNHIVKYSGNYTIVGDTILMENIDNFPCFKAGITFNGQTNMIFSATSMNDKGKKIKTEYYFTKEAKTHSEKALNSLVLKQNEEYIFSTTDYQYNGVMFIRSLSESVSLIINNKDNVTLTGDYPFLVLDEHGYQSKTKEDLKKGDKVVCYFDKASKTINSSHNNQDVKEFSIGEVLFWNE